MIIVTFTISKGRYSMVAGLPQVRKWSKEKKFKVTEESRSDILGMSIRESEIVTLHGNTEIKVINSMLHSLRAITFARDWAVSGPTKRLSMLTTC